MKDKTLKNIVNVSFQADLLFFPNLIALLESNREEKFCYNVICDSIPLAWRKFRKCYKLVVAAGGLVRNKKNKILFIYRNKKWDLPKGKADYGELIHETALREVREECAITNLTLVDYITETYHTYGPVDDRRLKKTYWYLMYSEDKDLIPQKEEGITKIKWVKEEKLEKYFENTFPSIIDVVRQNLSKQSVLE